MYCQICGTDEARFVRDHDHRTGFIRGVLCEVCNSFLGVFEAKLLGKKRKGSRNYRRWEASFEIKIQAYLKQTTPYRFPQASLDLVWYWFTKGAPSAGAPQERSLVPMLEASLRALGHRGV